MEQEECDVERECVGLNKKNGRQDKSQCCMKGMDFFWIVSLLIMLEIVNN